MIPAAPYAQQKRRVIADIAWTHDIKFFYEFSLTERRTLWRYLFTVEQSPM
jgi:hypothetical protein